MTTVAIVMSVVVLAFAAVLRAAGASVVNLPRVEALRRAAEGDERAIRIATLLEDRTVVQPSVSVVHSALLVAAALPAAWAVTALWSGWPLVIALIVVGVAVVFFGDLVPRTLGRNRSTWSYRFSRLLVTAVRFGDTATDIIDPDDDDDDEEDDDDAESDREELELISSVLEFSDTLVREVMMPRTDMVVIDRDKTSDDAFGLMVEKGFSRIPVFGEGVDDIIGVVYAKDLQRMAYTGAPAVGMDDVMRIPYFVPETKLVPDLLRDMQASKVHMAIVVDEFGGTAGIVTIEDLLEELVGEILDEHDPPAPAVERTSDGYRIDARMPIDDLNDLLGVELPDEEWDTVAGLVLELAGRVPIEGEHFEFDGVYLVAERVQGRRVERVRIGRRPLRASEMEQA